MLFEISSIIVATVLSLSGGPVSPVEAGFSPLNAMSCGAYDANTCLQSDICDVFIASSGGESCALACDLRDAATCELGSECKLTSDGCGYRDKDPVGC